MDNKEILRLINEWKRGCSDAPPEKPELCPQCTRGLIDAIEHKAKQEFFQGEFNNAHSSAIREHAARIDAIKYLELSGQPITSTAIEAIVNRLRDHPVGYNKDEKV